MLALALVTHTNDCFNKWKSFESLGHEVIVEQYDNRPHDRHIELVELAKRIRPDLIIYIGAIEQTHYCKPVPTPDILCRLREVAPSVHICGDGSDKAWWSWLEKYEQQECFSVQVNIDGNRNSPIASFDNGLILLTPIDPRAFSPRPWGARNIHLGMVGGIGHTYRQAVLNALKPHGLRHDYADPVSGRSYAEMGEIMSRTKITLNIPTNGSGSAPHVKGRVLEAGFAGCCLLEGVGTTSDWFTPGIDYLEYDSVDAAIRLLSETSDEHCQLIAAQLHKRVLSQHSPEVFWEEVLYTAGVDC